MAENEMSKFIFNSGLKAKKAIGSVFFEGVYEKYLYYELQKQSLLAEKQKTLPLIYEYVKNEIGYRVDLMVENKVLSKIKSVEALKELQKIFNYYKHSKLC